MAHYVTSVSTPLPVAEAFAYMADVTHFVEWDPGIVHVAQIQGSGPSVGSAYALTVKTLGTTVMRYDVTAFEAPFRMVLESRTPFLKSVDEIRVEPSGTGSRVTYDAQLTLRGPLRHLDPALRVAFRFIGDRAAAGLKRVLSKRV
jgi:carbon monoxide dehydrogenase subunit G